MRVQKSIAASVISVLILCGCSDNTAVTETTISDTSISETEVSESVTTTAEVWIPTDNDIEISEWFTDCMTDPEDFTDLNDYRYYARAIGQEMDFLLAPEMWEVYYSEGININREIENTDIYLIRLNPYKLLEIYAENNGCTVEELCKKLSVSKEQLYYNWGYNPASVNYFERHKKNEVTYSEDEQAFFGVYNSENRDVVMKTHMLVIDHNEDMVVYHSDVNDSLQIYRRDTLGAYSDGELWSEFTEAEKAAAFRINGIGIRAVIPLSMPNAIQPDEDDEERIQGDEAVTLMINASPYSYGCTDDDMIDISAVIEYVNGGNEE